MSIIKVFSPMRWITQEVLGRFPLDIVLKVALEGLYER